MVEFSVIVTYITEYMKWFIIKDMAMNKQKTNNNKTKRRKQIIYSFD